MVESAHIVGRTAVAVPDSEYAVGIVEADYAAEEQDLDLERVWRTQRHSLQAFSCSSRRTRARDSRIIGTSIELLVGLAELNIARLLGHITTTLGLQLERYRLH